MEKPDVDLIEGLSPAISIEQKATSHNPALDGRHRHRNPRLPAPALRPRWYGTHCPDHHRPLEAQTVSPDGRPRAGAARPETKLMILAPVVANRKGEQADLSSPSCARRVSPGCGSTARCMNSTRCRC